MSLFSAGAQHLVREMAAKGGGRVSIQEGLEHTKDLVKVCEQQSDRASGARTYL